MGDYLGKTGLSRLWTKIKDKIDAENEPLYLAIDEILEMIESGGSGGGSNIVYGEAKNEQDSSSASIDIPNAKYVKATFYSLNYYNSSETIDELEIEIAWNDENYCDYAYLQKNEITGATIEYINGMTIIKNKAGNTVYAKKTPNISYYSFWGIDLGAPIELSVFYKIEY